MRTQIIEAFKLEGLVLDLASRDLVERHVTSIRNSKNRQSELARIVDHVTANPELSTAKVTADLVEEAIRAGSEDTAQPAVEDILVLDHKSLPVTIYDPIRKNFNRRPATSRAFYATDRPFDRIQAMRERYLAIHQRVLNHHLFRKPAVYQGGKTGYRELTPISSLRRAQGQLCAVLGLLTQPREGAFCLEDCSHSIEVEMSEETIASQGLFTENCVVLAEGKVDADKFRIEVLALPPVEERRETCKTFPTLSSMLESSSGTVDCERFDENTSLILLSDVWLDRPKVQTGLRVLFSQYNKTCSDAEIEDRERFIFVLMGDFSSQPAPCGVDYHRGLFDRLGRLLKSFPALLECSSFVVMPGPNDILGGSGKMLPRQSFADIITADLTKQVPSSFVFTSNPCRIKFYSQEIVLFRDDICAKLRKYSRKPKEGGVPCEVHEHAIKTILSQGHLCPLPIEAAPVDWSFDHALRLYPLPHVLLLGCRSKHFNYTERQVKVANPSSFATELSFAVYKPFRGDCDRQLGREYQGELGIYSLDAALVDQQTVVDKPKDEAPARKKRKSGSDARRSLSRDAAVAGAEVAGLSKASTKTPSTKTPMDKPRRNKHALAGDSNQPRMGSFLLPRAAPAKFDQEVAADESIRVRGRKRLSRRRDSLDSESNSEPEEEEGQRGVGGDEHEELRSGEEEEAERREQIEETRWRSSGREREDEEQETEQADDESSGEQAAGLEQPEEEQEQTMLRSARRKVRKLQQSDSDSE